MPGHAQESYLQGTLLSSGIFLTLHESEHHWASHSDGTRRDGTERGREQGRIRHWQVQCKHSENLSNFCRVANGFAGILRLRDCVRPATKAELILMKRDVCFIRS